MERMLTSQLTGHVGGRVTVAGWLHQVRALGSVTFVLLRDRTGIVQAVFEREPPELAGIQAESVLAITGTVVAESRAALGVELHDAAITVLSAVTETLPFELNKRTLKPTLETFLDHAPVGLRHPAKQATFRVVAAVTHALRQAFIARACTEIHTPKLVGGATEGGANLFNVEYFDRRACLAQSPQLYKQIMVGVFERVFEIAPVFRAEPHATTRHLNEYVSVDVEIGFIEDHRTVMAFLTSALAEALAAAGETCAADLYMLGADWPVVGEIPSIHFRDAMQLIYERYGEDARGEPDLAPQHERWLCERSVEEFGSPFLFVTHYPTRKRPWYTMPDPAEPEYTHGFDLLFRGLEIVTGGQRIHRPEQLLANMARFGVAPEPVAGYLEAFRYGMPPHGGFAIGLERLVMQLLGARNVRETTLFPRDIHRLAP